MPVLTRTKAVVTCRAEGSQSEIHVIPDGAIAWRGGTIEWVGPADEVPGAYEEELRIDANEHLVVPGLVDCHTHLAFGGWRGDEFEMRILGRDYREIARAGGGIASTMKATRAASEGELVERAAAFLKEMLRHGTTTLEAKSGYGLNLEDELKTLRVYRHLNEAHPPAIIPTLLGAHVVPPEYANDRGGYLQLLIEELIPQAAEAGLARYCDAFVEDTAFSVEEGRRVLEAAAGHGLGAKLHADQLSDTGGAALAASVDAVSADHLECISPEGIRAIAESGTVAVSLPIATLYLNQQPLPARDLIEAGVPVAVATDFNPGSAPSHHLPFAMTLACTMQRMTPAEVLKGATLYGARAIGEEERVGSLEAGKQADFLLVDAPSVNHWLYHFRGNAVQHVYVAGEPVE